MTESILFRSYRETENRKAKQALDAALARVEATGVAEPPPGGVSPDQSMSVRTIRGGDTMREPERQPGVAASIGRSLTSIPKRFFEGIDTIGGVFRPVTPAERGEAPVDPHGLVLQQSTFEKILQYPVTRLVLGGLNVAFPFTAFAESTGGDFHDWVSASAEGLTDERLKEGLALSQKAGNAADVAHYQELLKIPHADRVKIARESAELWAGALAGTLPGYTTAGEPPARPRR